MQTEEGREYLAEENGAVRVGDEFLEFGREHFMKKRSGTKCSSRMY